MANIHVAELHPAGSELFIDSESFLNDLHDVDTISVHGGEGYGLNSLYGLNFKILESGLVGLGITNVVSLVKSFSSNGLGGFGGTTGAGTGSAAGTGAGIGTGSAAGTGVAANATPASSTITIA